MSTTIYKPYSYFIGWSKQRKYYYGARWGQNCSPNDLWETYFTSSKHVAKFREQYGEPDILEIRKVFTNGNDARDYEHKVLRRMGVVQNDLWLNRCSGKAPFLIGEKSPRFGKTHSKETKRKMSIAHIGKKFTEEHKRKIGIANKGKIVSEATKQKLRIVNSGKNSPRYGKLHTKEAKQKMRTAHMGEKNPFYGKKLSKKHQKKMLAARIAKGPYGNGIIANGHFYIGYKVAAKCLNCAPKTIRNRIRSCNFPNYYIAPKGYNNDTKKIQ